MRLNCVALRHTESVPTSDDPVIFGCVGNVFIVRWRSPITDEAAARVMAAMTEARREAGQPIVNISILPPEAGDPTPERNASITSRLPIVSHLCEALYVVVPATSPSHDKWHRSAAPSVTITRTLIEMCDSSKQACDRAAIRLGVDADRLFDEARGRGLIADA